MRTGSRRAGATAASESWFRGDRLIVGREHDGRRGLDPARRCDGGTHTLVVGATGSGKTVTMTWMAARAIERGMGAIVVDPKGDRDLRRELRDVALAAGRRFIEWTPRGPSVYNPYARGSETEIADKALAGERFTEPHYLRQAQRYLGHEVRALRRRGSRSACRRSWTTSTRRGWRCSREACPSPAAQGLHDYLDSLTTRQQSDLAGVRDRLAIMAESDIGTLARPANGGHASSSICSRPCRARAVVYFNLEADRRPLLAQMLGAAIVQDLQAMVAALQGRPVPTLVVIDEFSAIVARAGGGSVRPCAVGRASAWCWARRSSPTCACPDGSGCSSRSWATCRC